MYSVLTDCEIYFFRQSLTGMKATISQPSSSWYLWLTTNGDLLRTKHVLADPETSKTLSPPSGSLLTNILGCSITELLNS